MLLPSQCLPAVPVPTVPCYCLPATPTPCYCPASACPLSPCLPYLATACLLQPHPATACLLQPCLLLACYSTAYAFNGSQRLPPTLPATACPQHCPLTLSVLYAPRSATASGVLPVPPVCYCLGCTTGTACLLQPQVHYRYHLPATASGALLVLPACYCLRCTTGTCVGSLRCRVRTCVTCLGSRAVRLMSSLCTT